jgi:hypothetical protein
MTVNSSNTSEVLSALVNDFTELNEKVDALADAVELLGVANKKQLGPDAEAVFDNVDTFRNRTRQGMPDMDGTLTVRTNDIGAVFSDRRDSARED